MSWPSAALCDVAPAKSIKLEEIVANGEVWQITLDHIESGTGKLLEKSVKPLSEAGSSTHAFDSRHVLYSKLRPYLNKVLLPDEVGLGTTELVPLLPDSERLDRNYLAHYLKSKRFVNWVSNKTTGAKMPRVSMKAFWEHKIPLPPLTEQKRIAAILDKADAIRRKRQQAIDLADQFLRSVFLDMFGDPVTNHNVWPMGTIRDLVAEAKYGTSQKADIEKGAFPILRMGNITYEGGWDFSNLKYVDIDEKDQEKYLVQERDLLFNRTNSKELVGKMAVYDQPERMAVAGYLIRVRTNEKGNPYYLSGYLNSDHGKSTLRSMCKNIVGMANINAQEMQNIKILLPPVEKQEKFESIAKAVKSRVLIQQSALLELNKLFGSLSQEAFSGRL